MAQSYLSDYEGSLEAGPDSQPSEGRTHPQGTLNWSAVDTQDERECRRCGRQWDEQYRRVHGDNDDRLHACHDCVTKTEMQNGASWDPDYPVGQKVAEKRLPSAGGNRAFGWSQTRVGEDGS